MLGGFVLVMVAVTGCASAGVAVKTPVPRRVAHTETAAPTTTSAARPTGTTLVPTPYPADDGATVVRQTIVAQREIDVAISSPALGSIQNVRLLLPPDWDAQPDTKWPVFYLLHGCCGNYQNWTEASNIVQLSANTDVLVAMPEGGPAGYYSNWQHGPAWATFHLTEVRQLLERDFRGGQNQAIAGLSMGAFGAMSYAALNPGMFKVAASYSGLLDTTYNQASIDQIESIVTGPGGAAADALWGNPNAGGNTWNARNPYTNAAGLRGTQLYISAGSGNPGPLNGPHDGFDPSEQLVDQESTLMVQELRKLGIPVTTDLGYAGTHAWPYWNQQLNLSFPMLMKAIGAVQK